METVNRYLELIDAALPERIAGLYLTGSIALGDYRPGQSDIDFVAVTNNRLSAEELEEVEALLKEDKLKLSRQIYRDLEREYEYQTSDEVVAETIMGHEMDFFSDGRRFQN